jgi:peroxiredoxin
MNNINVVRVGFYAPEIKLPDITGDIKDPVDRSGEKLTCLIFVNPDEIGGGLISDLENNQTLTAGGYDWSISAIVPVKLKLAKEFKEHHELKTRIFCDSDLRAGNLYSIIDSSLPRPTYHPVVFIIGDEGSVRYRQVMEKSGFDMQKFQSSVSKLI